jgi:MFS family permease
VVSPGGRLSRDARLVLGVQALRAGAYGLGSVLIGVSLERAGLSTVQVGVVLGSLLAGAALASIGVARWGDRIGRRRAYAALLVVMGLAGSVFALTSWLPALVLAGLTGTVSTDVVESGPFTSLEQAMLSHAGGDTTRLLGHYNTAATVAGSLGALAAVALTGQRWLLLYAVAAVLALPLAAGLSPAIELRDRAAGRLHRSRGTVQRLSALFALDSLGGGFVVQTFIAYWLTLRFDVSPQLLGVLFFSFGLLQALSFQVAVRLAGRFGLLRTMVFTHLPSNLLLIAVAFAPTLEVAIVLLLARVSLSQMDVPTRQAYVVGIVDPDERTAAAAYTNTARYVVRPVAPVIAGALLQGAWLGAPFLVAGTLKSAYDLALWGMFRSRRG